MSNTASAIVEVRRLDAAARQGPWALCEDEDDPDYPYRFYVAAGQRAICGDMDEADAALIARYRTLATLLAEALEIAVRALNFYAELERRYPGRYKTSAQNPLAAIEAVLGQEGK